VFDGRPLLVEIDLPDKGAVPPAVIVKIHSRCMSVSSFW